MLGDRTFNVLFVLVLLATLLCGCAESRYTTRTTETTTTDQPGAGANTAQTEATTTTTTQSTSTETTSSQDAGPKRTGIFGGALHVIGTILAFPFKVIGNLLEAIF